MIFKTHQIQISCFSRHFYEVNLILVLPQIHWTNFDKLKILFIFYDIIFKAMTFSVCSEADQNISDRLTTINQVDMEGEGVLLKSPHYVNYSVNGLQSGTTGKDCKVDYLLYFHRPLNTRKKS